jgi:hypothetical protein
MILKGVFRKLAQIKILHFSLVLSGIFFAAALINILNHEMWRDEFQGWLLARDSETIGDLFRNTRAIRSYGTWGCFSLVKSLITRSSCRFIIY